MNTLENIKIGFVVTGSFCTIPKIFKVIKRLLDMGSEVFPIMSEHASTIDTRFGSAQDNIKELESLTGKKIMNKIEETELIGPNNLYDILVVAPCTGNTMAKLTNGITDTSALMAIKSTLRNNKPVVIALATNDGMGLNYKNIGVLMNVNNVFFVPLGQDNCKTKSKSLVADLEKIPETILDALNNTQLQPVLIKY